MCVPFCGVSAVESIAFFTHTRLLAESAVNIDRRLTGYKIVICETFRIPSLMSETTICIQVKAPCRAANLPNHLPERHCRHVPINKISSRTESAPRK